MSSPWMVECDMENAPQGAADRRPPSGLMSSSMGIAQADDAIEFDKNKSEQASGGIRRGLKTWLLVARAAEERRKAFAVIPAAGVLSTMPQR